MARPVDEAAARAGAQAADTAPRARRGRPGARGTFRPSRPVPGGARGTA